MRTLALDPDSIELLFPPPEVRYISPLSPLYLPSISPISPLYLPDSIEWLFPPPEGRYRGDTGEIQGRYTGDIRET